MQTSHWLKRLGQCPLRWPQDDVACWRLWPPAVQDETRALDPCVEWVELDAGACWDVVVPPHECWVCWPLVGRLPWLGSTQWVIDGSMDDEADATRVIQADSTNGLLAPGRRTLCNPARSPRYALLIRFPQGVG